MLGHTLRYYLPRDIQPVLLQRKARTLRKQTDNPELHAKGQKPDAASHSAQPGYHPPYQNVVSVPLITGLSLYISVSYGFTYLLFSTFGRVFQDQYQYRDANLGLTYLGLAGGMLVGLSVTSILLDRTYLYLTRKFGVAKCRLSHHDFLIIAILSVSLTPV